MPKILPPTLREKNRYLAFQIHCETKLTRDDVVKAVWNTILRTLGEIGAGKTGLWVMDWNEEKQKGIARINHHSIKETQAALTLTAEINKKLATIKTLGVSGTLKKAREKYMN